MSEKTIENRNQELKIKTKVLLNHIKEVSTRRANILGPMICLIFALIFVLIPVWHLAVLAGVIGGLFHKKMGRGALTGLIGVGSAWILNIFIELISTNVYGIIDQIGGIILGSIGFGWLFIIVIILLGIALGALGGSIGSGIRYFIELKKEKQ